MFFHDYGANFLRAIALSYTYFANSCALLPGWEDSAFRYVVISKVP